MALYAGIQSAEAVAALRAAVAKEKALAVRCEDHWAWHFLGTKYRWLSSIWPQPLLRTIVHLISPGSYCFVITRTRHFDEVLLSEARSGIEQVVVLGAGFDSRSLRFQHELKGVVVYEVDHPETQAHKRRILKNVVEGGTSHVRYVSVDFNHQSLNSALVDNGFSHDKRTLFLWEGVSYYVQPSMVEDIIRFVGDCADGSSIVFDYAIRSFVDGNDSTYGGREISKWLKKIGERFVFGLNNTEIETFLSGCGLKMISDLGPEELEKRYLKTNNDRRLLGRSLGHVRMVHARVVKCSLKI